jgi:hypothetical protein
MAFRYSVSPLRNSVNYTPAAIPPPLPSPPTSVPSSAISHPQAAALRAERRSANRWRLLAAASLSQASHNKSTACSRKDRRSIPILFEALSLSFYRVFAGADITLVLIAEAFHLLRILKRSKARVVILQFRSRGYALRLQREDLAVLLDVDRRAVHAGGLARDLGGAPERAADGGGKLLRRFVVFDTFLHRQRAT